MTVDIPAGATKKVIDAAELVITLGLVDMHVHVYACTGMPESFASDCSPYPDGSCLPSDVTTAVNPGSP